MHKSTNRNYTSRREVILHTIQIRVAENIFCIQLVTPVVQNILSFCMSSLQNSLLNEE